MVRRSASSGAPPSSTRLTFLTAWSPGSPTWPTWPAGACKEVRHGNLHRIMWNQARRGPGHSLGNGAGQMMGRCWAAFASITAALAEQLAPIATRCSRAPCLLLLR